MRAQIDPKTWAALSALLDAALDLLPEEREGWIAGLGPECEQLKAPLRTLLARQASVETADFLNTLPKLDVGLLAIGQDAPAQDGDTVGPYRLIAELGSGGMGVVWLAQRSDGLLERRVALKFPHGTWNRKGLAERMARERALLATLEHRCIARLYDAGVTATGQPYLALEYVDGQPLDVYCTQHRLDVRKRLGLFLQVLDAVAYAHSKLIIHRDLKPANILVTAAREVRLLDFGIAKLLDEQQSDARVTQFAGQALTPDYASPEQIAGLPLGVGTDIYSLGVILYELLTEQRPYRLKRNSRGALEDAILEADPARPSHVAPRARQRQLQGDLDAIILKALKKNAHERYATVNSLIEDLERHRAHRPVLARPDGTWYRCGRFVRRNRVAAVGAALVTVAVIAGTGTALWQAHLASVQQRRAEEVNAFILSIFEQADPYRKAGAALSGAALLDRAREDLARRFADRPDLRIELLNVIASSLMNLNELPAAEQILREVIEEAKDLYGRDHPLTLQARVLEIEIDHARRDPSALRHKLEELLPAASARVDTHPEILVRALKSQANLAFLEGRWERIEAPIREALQIARRRLGSDHPLTMSALSVLAEAFVVGEYPVSTRIEETRRALDEALAAHDGRHDHPQVLRMREIHGRALAVAGHFHEAVAEHRSLIDSLSRILGPTSRAVAHAMGNVAPYERWVGELAESLEHTERTLQLFDGRLARDSVDYAFVLTSRGVTLLTARRPQPALADLEEAEKTYRALFGEEHWDTLTARMNRAVALAYLGRFTEAREALAAARGVSGGLVRPWWIAHVTGIVQRLEGAYGDAIASQREAERLVPEGPRARWERMRVLSERGLAELAHRDPDSARSSLSRALDLYVELDVRMHPPYAEVMTALGATFIDGEPRHALALLEDANRYWLEFDPHNPAAGAAALWLARGYEALGRQAEADAALGRAERILASSPLPSHKQLLAADRRR